MVAEDGSSYASISDQMLPLRIKEPGMDRQLKLVSRQK
jgi:hypothetical protein